MESAKDPRLQQILEQLKKFDFTFLSFDESGIPLVKGPNNQVVQINVAIAFVNDQIKHARENAASGSIENPNLDSKINVASAETGLEKVPEKVDQKLEQAIEKKQEVIVNRPQAPQIQVPAKSPTVVLKKPFIKPYDAGFDPKVFDMSDINKTISFIERNASKPATSSHKWLAEQFKKFLKEMEK